MSILQYLKENARTVSLIVFLVVLFIAAGYFVYSRMEPEINAKTQQGDSVQDSPGGEGQSTELIFFYANWCPHCKAAKPHWNEIKEKYADKSINGYEIIFTEVDCSEETEDVKDKVEQYNVEGYPTIKLIKGDQIIDFDAKPTKNTLEKFLETVL